MIELPAALVNTGDPVVATTEHARPLALTVTDRDRSCDSPSFDLLGPWALTTDEQLALDWGRFGFLRPFNGRIAEAAAVSRLAAEWLLARWVARLNDRHRRDYSVRYWGILLRAWLITLVDCAFDKYVRLAARARSPHRVTVAPAQPFSPADTRDFLIALQNEPLNGFILSALACGLGSDKWTVTAGEPTSLSESSRLRRRERALRARHWLAVLASTAGRVQFYNVYGMTLADAFRLSCRTARRARPAQRAHADDVAPAVEESRATALREFERQGFGTLAEAERFLVALDELSLSLLPASFGDGYDSQERAARRRAACTAPWIDTIVCGPALGGDDQAKFYVAWMVEKRGVHLIVSQHGGNYGLLQTYSFVAQTDYRCADCFLSWGWREQSGCNVEAIPAASPFLDRLRHRPSASRLVILVGTDVPPYNTRIDSALFAEDAGKYRADQIAFVRGLSTEVRDRLAFRPYSRTAAFEREYWTRHAPGTPFLTGALDGHLEQSALVVVDHPGTTALQALAAGIPTVLFWDPEVWCMSPSAAPSIERLLEAGVFHTDPQAAARHVTAVSGDVAGWWNASATRQAVSAFTTRYCRSNPEWRAEWTKLFSNRASPVYAKRGSAL